MHVFRVESAVAKISPFRGFNSVVSWSKGLVGFEEVEEPWIIDVREPFPFSS